MSVWLWLPLAGPTRISTVATAAVLFLLITILRRDPIRALVVTLAWASAFEIVYDLVGVIVFGWSLAPMAWQTAALMGWVVLASALGVWPDWRVVAVFALLMATWVATGYHANLPGQGPVNVQAEILNEGAKSVLAAAYLAGALTRRPQSSSTPTRILSGMAAPPR